MISLVITIVIMLILVGVTISFVIGQNGLFEKSKDGAKKYSDAAIKEELQTVSSAIYLEDTNNITNEKIANEMSKQLPEIVWQNKSLLAGTYKGYDFYINNQVVTMEKLNTDPLVIKNTNDVDNKPRSEYNVERENIKNITILVDDEPKYSDNAIDGMKWDMDYYDTNRGGILAYFEPSGDDSVPYNLYIVGRDKIKLLESCFAFFYDFKNVASITGLENFDTTGVTNMLYMFNMFGYNNLTSLVIPDSFDTYNVTNMNGMFAYFGYCKLQSFVLPETFNTSNVTDMTSMFDNFGHDSMTSFDLGSNFYTSKVIATQSMFSGCGYEKMSSLDLGTHFDMSNVVNCCLMFKQCGYKSMTTLNLGDSFNTNKAANMHSMFTECGYMSLTSLNLGNRFNIDHISSANNANWLFDHCGYISLARLTLGTSFKIPS